MTGPIFRGFGALPDVPGVLASVAITPSGAPKLRIAAAVHNLREAAEDASHQLRSGVGLVEALAILPVCDPVERQRLAARLNTST